MSQFSLVPQNFAQAIEAAERFATSGMVPKQYAKTPDNPNAANKILIAWELGSSLGLGLMQSLQGIAVVNGMPTVWGDSALAIILASGQCEDLDESITGELTDPKTKAICKVKRVGKPVKIYEFSVMDAKTAGLLGKAGVWSQYPKRMLQMRARGFALRDAFADVLKGMKLAEEAGDYTDPYPDAVNTTGTVSTDTPQNFTAALEQQQAETIPVKVEPQSEQPAGEVTSDTQEAAQGTFDV